jgi:hypothetical protein
LGAEAAPELFGGASGSLERADKGTTHSAAMANTNKLKKNSFAIR